MTTTAEKRSVHVRLPPDVYEDLAAMAAEAGLSRTALASRLITAVLPTIDRVTLQIIPKGRHR